VAVVIASDEAIAIGLDIEKVGAVEAALWPDLFSPAEREFLRRGNSREQAANATALFAAKEAFYKAQWPLTREWVDFLDIEIELKEARFLVVPRAPKGWSDRFEAPVRGSIVMAEGYAAAGLHLGIDQTTSRGWRQTTRARPEPENETSGSSDAGPLLALSGDDHRTLASAVPAAHAGSDARVYPAGRHRPGCREAGPA
jgi:phosphopantetheinyl transferase (holo-ACP synthase)